jgi:hypothetical protein
MSAEVKVLECDLEMIFSGEAAFLDDMQLRIREELHQRQDELGRLIHQLGNGRRIE